VIINAPANAAFNTFNIVLLPPCPVLAQWKLARLQSFTIEQFSNIGLLDVAQANPQGANDGNKRCMAAKALAMGLMERRQVSVKALEASLGACLC
jgi:hypothetical protein